MCSVDTTAFSRRSPCNTETYSEREKYSHFHRNNANCLNNIHQCHKNICLRHGNSSPRHENNSSCYENNSQCHADNSLRHANNASCHADNDSRHADNSSCHATNSQCHADNGRCFSNKGHGFAASRHCYADNCRCQTNNCLCHARCKSSQPRFSQYLSVFGKLSGCARLFAEKLCFSVGLYRDFAAMPPLGGLASRIVGSVNGEARASPQIERLSRETNATILRRRRLSRVVHPNRRNTAYFPWIREM